MASAYLWIKYPTFLWKLTPKSWRRHHHKYDHSFCLQKVGCISEMLATMKLLCLHMWPNEVKNVDGLRLDVALRMIKSPHFNAKMNSLKEVTFLCLDSFSKCIEVSILLQLKTFIFSSRIILKIWCPYPLHFATPSCITGTILNLSGNQTDRRRLQH